jgi:hypothetical protein
LFNFKEKREFGNSFQTIVIHYGINPEYFIIPKITKKTIVPAIAAFFLLDILEEASFPF